MNPPRFFHRAKPAVPHKSRVRIQFLVNLLWIDPLTDPRWHELALRHPLSSMFHTRGWLEALRRTYAFEPAALVAQTPGGDLTAGMLFCRIASPFTGRRLVSLPFTDHCEPLAESDADRQRLFEGLHDEQAKGRWRYIEWRPREPVLAGPFGAPAGPPYWLHRLDLSVGIDALRRALHPNHVRRKIKRSERELEYRTGRSDALLDAFFALFLQTRRRHGLPPQPYGWFRNVLDCLPDAASLRVAFNRGDPVAAIMTLRERGTMVFKYGASDHRFHPLGGTHLLLWRAIEDAVSHGCDCLDLGRTDVANSGLAAFKENWGAKRAPLVYWRYPRGETVLSALARPAIAAAKWAVTFAPDRVLTTVGRLVYPHIG